MWWQNFNPSSEAGGLGVRASQATNETLFQKVINYLINFKSLRLSDKTAHIKCEQTQVGEGEQNNQERTVKHIRRLEGEGMQEGWEQSIQKQVKNSI
jgi:hypothetical protein